MSQQYHASREDCGRQPTTKENCPHLWFLRPAKQEIEPLDLRRLQKLQYSQLNPDLRASSSRKMLSSLMSR
jgi:hypothetical protein